MFVMKFLLVVIAIFLSSDQARCDEDDLKIDQNENSTTFYTAAVVEFNAPGDKFSDTDDIVDANLAEYLSLIQEAGEQGVDILVFSEATLNYNGITSYENLTEVAVELQVEVPSILDCDYSHDVILSELSFAAANASLYVLVNVVEREPCNDNELTCPTGFHLYNTNFVFDRNGCIVSRYRKFNLFLEPFMNVTEKPDVSSFETDFGVTFGHFICFDLLFKSPALDLVKQNVTHFLYPSMWFSEIPFLTSVQIQQSFAQRNNIVLLSAGANSPSNANTGSGIYVGVHGAVDKMISFRNETRMLIAEVPKNVNDPEYEPMAPPHEPYTSKEMNEMKVWNSSLKNAHSLSHQSLLEVDNGICKFNISYTSDEALTKSETFGYRLVAFSGTRSYSGIINAGEVQCAIVPCVDPSNEATCGHKPQDSVSSITFHRIEITFEFHGDENNCLIMPTSLDTSILPLSSHLYEFESHKESDGNRYSMKSTQELRGLLTFGIYGRNYALDNKNMKESSDEDSSDEMLESDDSYENGSNTEKVDEEVNDLHLKMTIYISLMVVLSIATSVMVYRKLQTPYIKPDNNRRKPSMREL